MILYSVIDKLLLVSDHIDLRFLCVPITTEVLHTTGKPALIYNIKMRGMDIIVNETYINLFSTSSKFFPIYYQFV